MDQQLLDAFLERLEQRIYIDGTIIVKEGYPVSRMFFVLKGEVIRSSNKSGMIGHDQLSLGEFVGEEVLVQYIGKYSKDKLARSSSRKFASGRESWASARDALASRRVGATFRSANAAGGSEAMGDVLPTSRFTALCVGPVEGYSLEAKDVEAVCRQYWKLLQDEKVQMALNRCSRARMMHFARTIQLAWRRYQREKYGIALADCVRAATERRFGKLVTLKKSESSAKKLEEVLNGADEDDDDNDGDKATIE